MIFPMIENKLLMHPFQQNPCYRKVICYSLFKFLKKNSSEEAQKELLKLKNQVKRDQLYLLKGCIAVYPVVMNENGGIGLLIVDGSRDCFPLVCYPDAHSEYDGFENAARRIAFMAALDILVKNCLKIFPILANQIKQGKEWDSELESKLRGYFEYPKDKAANDDDFNINMKKSG